VPQRWYQKTTVQASIVGGVFVVVAAMIASYRRDVAEPPLPTISQPESSNRVELSKDNPYSAQGMNQRARLRTGLRLITATESGLLPSKVPSGRYAFAHPLALEYGESKMLRSPEYGRLTFEAHKTESGEFLVVAFVNADEHRKLIVSAKVSSPVTLYSDFWDEARYAALVDPTSCHGEGRGVTLDDGSRITAVDCEPAVDEAERRSAP